MAVAPLSEETGYWMRSFGELESVIMDGLWSTAGPSSVPATLVRFVGSMSVEEAAALRQARDDEQRRGRSKR